ncbi:hypothetical protein B0H13DRAFT_2395120 [Mycena leptocephala]|nr:hypothetical protein B0H13DRAFT_2395120 [Mycena leptocephala]
MSYPWSHDPQVLGWHIASHPWTRARHNGDSEGETGALETGEEFHDPRLEDPGDSSRWVDQVPLSPEPHRNIDIPQDFWDDMASRASIAPKFLGSVGTCIPQIIDLLKDEHSDVREAGAKTLLKLSGQGT